MGWNTSSQSFSSFQNTHLGLEECHLHFYLRLQSRGSVMQKQHLLKLPKFCILKAVYMVIPSSGLSQPSYGLPCDHLQALVPFVLHKKFWTAPYLIFSPNFSSLKRTQSPACGLRSHSSSIHISPRKMFEIILLWLIG